MYQYHDDGTLPAGDEIFVFGSNEAGRHGAGAARLAMQAYGAKYGEGWGFQGRSFAIPTKDTNIQTLPVDVIQEYVELFIANAERFYEEKFFMTRIGCGLAGYLDEDIAPLFRGAPTNINFPIDWKTYLET